MIAAIAATDRPAHSMRPDSAILYNRMATNTLEYAEGPPRRRRAFRIETGR